MSSNADLMQMALRLRAVAHDDGSIDAAQVRVIGLDEIREAAGANWPRMRERVRSGSMEILAKHAAAEDVIVPAGDGFLVILAEGAPGNNQDRCNKMRDALLSFYLGEEALKSLRPQVTARTLSADGFADLISTRMHAGAAHAGSLERIANEEIVMVRIFSARESKVVAHWFSPVKHERGARRLAYNSDFILDGRHREPHFLDLDIELCQQAGSALEKEACTTPVGFTVHASTLQSRRSREAYFSMLLSLPPELRRRAIVTIAEIEKGTPLISISEWVSSLRAMLSRVCLDFHYTDHAIGSIGAAGAWAAGFHLPIYSGAQRGPRAARTLDQVRFWSKTIRAQGMRLAVNGFSDGDFLREAALAGVDIATSDVLWPFTAIEGSAPEQQPAVAGAG